MFHVCATCCQRNGEPGLRLGGCGHKMRTGNHFWSPAPLVCFLLRRGNVRGTSPTVRTARAVWSFAFRMHARWSHFSSRQHVFFLLLCTTNCKPFSAYRRSHSVPGGNGRSAGLYRLRKNASKLSFRALRCHLEGSEGSRSAQGRLREESRPEYFQGIARFLVVRQ